jgi:hypothetical protein
VIGWTAREGKGKQAARRRAGLLVVRYFPNHTYLRFDLGHMFVDYGGGWYANPMMGQVTFGRAGGIVRVDQDWSPLVKGGIKPSLARISHNK